MALPTSSSSTSAATANQSEGPFAIYPLTVFDESLVLAVMVLGWVVEGHADPNKLEQAVEAVTSKWPLIGGRLEKSGKMYQIRVPLGPVAKGYSTMITTSLAPRPFSHYVKYPLPLASPTLPPYIMQHPSTPMAVPEWIKQDMPTMCWHITHLSEGSAQYSCIGLTFPHLIYDGLGIATIVHAVESELLGQPWEVPRMLVPGLNVNSLEAALAKARQESEGDKEKGFGGTEGAAGQVTQRYSGMNVVSVWFLLSFLLWNWWQQVWHKSDRTLFALPASAVAKLIDTTRAALSEGEGAAKVSRGDILAAWLYKLFYAEEKSKRQKIHMINFASIRRFFNDELKDYPHNCVIPLPYPDMTVEDIQKHTVASFAQALARSRRDFISGSRMAVEAYHILTQSKAANKTCLALGTNNVENVAISNMCLSNIVNIDWSGTGAGRVIVRHKTGTVPFNVAITNVAIIVGYLDDGTLTIDVHLPEKRRLAVQRAMQQLLDDAEGYKSASNTV